MFNDFLKWLQNKGKDYRSDQDDLINQKKKQIETQNSGMKDIEKLIKVYHLLFEDYKAKKIDQKTYEKVKKRLISLIKEARELTLYQILHKSLLQKNTALLEPKLKNLEDVERALSLLTKLDSYKTTDNYKEIQIFLKKKKTQIQSKSLPQKKKLTQQDWKKLFDQIQKIEDKTSFQYKSKLDKLKKNRDLYSKFFLVDKKKQDLKKLLDQILSSYEQTETNIDSLEVFLELIRHMDLDTTEKTKICNLLSNLVKEYEKYDPLFQQERKKRYKNINQIKKICTDLNLDNAKGKIINPILVRHLLETGELKKQEIQDLENFVKDDDPLKGDLKIILQIMNEKTPNIKQKLNQLKVLKDMLVLLHYVSDAKKQEIIQNYMKQLQQEQKLQLLPKLDTKQKQKVLQSITNDIVSLKQLKNLQSKIPETYKNLGVLTKKLQQLEGQEQKIKTGLTKLQNSPNLLKLYLRQFPEQKTDIQEAIGQGKDYGKIRKQALLKTPTQNPEGQIIKLDRTIIPQNYQIKDEKIVQKMPLKVQFQCPQQKNRFMKDFIKKMA